MSNSRYTTTPILDQYLLFHYGKDEDLLPFSFGPKEALHFPVRCVQDCVKNLPANAKAIELGCAVGRTSFELARLCREVVGIDQSELFIETAKKIQQHQVVEYSLLEEGSTQVDRTAVLPEGIDASRVRFRCADAMEVVKEKGDFDLVFAANLVCRLPDPNEFLKNIYHLVKPEGQLVIISPYSWSEEFTARDKWLCGGNGQKCLETHLDKQFVLQKMLDIPFLLRVHRRKYEWGVSQATIWTRK